MGRIKKYKVNNMRWTKEKFIHKATELYGNKFDYSLIEFSDIKNSIKIKCQQCNYINVISAKQFLKGKTKCQRCEGSTQHLTKELFIYKAKKIHGDKYDYSLTDYINATTNIKIICNKCGCCFEKKPKDHLNGLGCLCSSSNSKIFYKEKFIHKATELYGNKFDYSLVEYKNNKTPVQIKCNICGNIFEQTIKAHLKNGKCSLCDDQKEKIANLFVEKAKAIHNDKFDYSFIKYINDKTKINVLCNNCKTVFDILPGNFINLKKCPLCQNRRKNTEQFIQEAKKIHGNKYDYSLVEYKNNKTKIKIICNKCGRVFMQTPLNHLNNQNCPYCKISKGEEIITNFLISKGYILNESFFKEKKFDDLIDEKKLRFDFYIPSKKMVIEFQGKQHYQSVDKWDGEEGLKLRQKHDQMKRDYCAKNGLKELEIKYNENILKILEREI